MYMTPRQRVLAALDHKQPDRIPIELGTTRASGIHILAYQHLLENLHLSWTNESTVRFSQVAIPSESMLQSFGVDSRPIMLGEADHSTAAQLPGEIWQDEWGVQRIKPEGSHYYDLCYSPLSSESLTIADLNRYPWPNPDDPGRMRGIAPRYEYLAQKTNYAILLHLGADLGLQTQYLRGFEQWFLDLGMRRELADALLDKVLDYQLQLAKNVLDALPGDVDVIYLVDDFATQQGLMISPRTYRSYLKPRQKKLIEYLKSRSQARILLHLCGSIVDILDDLVEIGVDGINPVQLTARGMDAEWLKSHYGDRLTFWGAVDGQELLPHSAPQEVAADVQRLVHILGEEGGYILGPCHNIQPDVPPENIVAMYMAAKGEVVGNQS